MSDALALLGYLVAGVGFVCFVGWLIARYEWEAERHDDISRAAAGMDEFSAPEGGRQP